MADDHEKQRRAKGVYFDDIITMLADPSVDDVQVAEALRLLVVSYNAETAGSELLAVACLMGRSRPSLFEAALAGAVDQIFCMDITTIEWFWRYTEHLQTWESAHLWWTSEALEFYRGELRKHDGLITRLLDERETAYQLEQSASK